MAGNDDLTAKETESPRSTLQELATLYDVEANLVQQKVGHLLAIRGLAVTVFSGILGAALINPTSGVEFVGLAILLLYYLDAVYDAYLIPIADREGALRISIASRLDGADEVARKTAHNYRTGISHRMTPESWSPFQRAFLEPQRIGLYAMLAVIPILVVHLTPLFGRVCP